MDVVAKHIPADKDGVRIAELDEMSYRRKLWDHRPMTDFWRFGRVIVARLNGIDIETMGQLARMSVGNEEVLYRMFGVNAELIIDHAWGWEPVTMDYIKAYRPETNSLGSGQVLQSAYTAEKGRVVAREMADALSLDLVDKLSRGRPDRPHGGLRPRESHQLRYPSAVSWGGQYRLVWPQCAEARPRHTDIEPSHVFLAADHPCRHRVLRPHRQPGLAHPAPEHHRQPRHQ